MADNGDDFGVDEFLRNGGPGLGVACVVFGDEFEHDFLAVDREAGFVDFFNGQARAVFVVFTEVGNSAGERADVTDLDSGVLGESRTAGSQQRDGRCERQKFCSKSVLHV